jgi:hypothetical protein
MEYKEGEYPFSNNVGGDFEINQASDTNDISILTIPKIFSRTKVFIPFD